MASSADFMLLSCAVSTIRIEMEENIMIKTVMIATAVIVPFTLLLKMYAIKILVERKALNMRNSLINLNNLPALNTAI